MCVCATTAVETAPAYKVRRRSFIPFLFTTDYCNSTMTRGNLPRPRHPPQCQPPPMNPALQLGKGDGLLDNVAVEFDAQDPSAFPQVSNFVLEVDLLFRFADQFHRIAVTRQSST